MDPAQLIEDWQAQARQLAHGIRRRVLEHTVANNGGYLSQACSSAEILGRLYGHIARLGPSQAAPIHPPSAAYPALITRPPPQGQPITARTRPTWIGSSFQRFITPCLCMSLNRNRAHECRWPGAVQSGWQHGRDDRCRALARLGSYWRLPGANTEPGRRRGVPEDKARPAGLVLMSDGEFQSGQTWEAFQAAGLSPARPGRHLCKW